MDRAEYRSYQRAFRIKDGISWQQLPADTYFLLDRIRIERNVTDPLQERADIIAYSLRNNLEISPWKTSSLATLARFFDRIV